MFESRTIHAIITDHCLLHEDVDIDKAREGKKMRECERKDLEVGDHIVQGEVEVLYMALGGVVLARGHGGERQRY